MYDDAAREKRNPDGPLLLTDLLCRGKESEVFGYPGRPSLIVKVLRSRVIERFGASRRLKSRLRAHVGIGPYKNYGRYYAGYLEAMLRAQSAMHLPPLAHPRGFVMTDRGLGLAMQKICEDSDDLAPPLRSLLETGAFDAEALARLNIFVTDLYAFNVIGTDVSPGNILYETRNGRNRFVLVDGIGARNILPLRRWLPGMNARALDRAFATLGKRTGLLWSPDSRSFRA